MFKSLRGENVSMFVTQAVGSADRLTPLHLPRHQGLLEEDVVLRIVPVLRGALIGRRAEKHFLFGDQNRRLRHRGFHYGLDASAPLCGVGWCHIRPVEASRRFGGLRDASLDTWKTFGHEGISLSRIGAARPRHCGAYSARTVPAAAMGLSSVAVE